MMESRVLGRSGIEVSPMGLGGLPIGGLFWRTDFDSVPWVTDRSKPFSGGWGPVDDDESIRAIRAGLDLGVNLIDTSSSYGCGHSERIIGKAIAGRRHEVVISTKFGNDIDEEKREYRGHDVAPDAIRASCEASLRRLDTDYIDVFLLHWSGYDGDAEPIVEVLEELVQAGKIRTYGWSNHEADKMDRFTKHANFAVVEFPHSVLQRSPEMLALCEERNLGALIRSPLSMGLLTGKFGPDTTFPEDDIRHGWNPKEGRMAQGLRALARIRDVLTSGGRTLAQGALAWIWAQSDRTVPIPGFKTVAQVIENAKAMEFGPLTQEQVQEVIDIVEATRKEQGLESLLR
jgi:aryl-alcohol dehydrogenase-like predicted oxidoreductase